MTTHPAVEDDDVVLRHIPGGTLWQAPGPRITSANFQIRVDRAETGVSVSRLSLTTPEGVLDRVAGGRTGDSRIAAASVRAIRDLGREVIPDPLPDDPGHAEIRSGAARPEDRVTRKRLANLFQFLAPTP
jgi:hypothetical protein